ncbi:MAG: hypothetical protein ACK5LN_00905 [Propioniciclava sp.]
MPRKNLPRRLFFLFLVFTVLGVVGMVVLFNVGLSAQSNPSMSVDPEFFPRVGRMFGGIIGACAALMLVSGITWMVRSRRPQA